MNKTFWMMMVLLGLTSQAAVADIPGTINFQGRLTDLAGNAVTDGTYGVTFTLHYTAEGNSPTGWSEVQNVVTERGYFSIALGSSTPLSSLGFNYPYYLEIQVAGDAQPMSPRQQLSSVPYAMRASLANQVPDNTISTNKIADDAVTYTKIASGADLPIGTILAWHKTFTGTPALPLQFVECNGQTISDPQSVYNGRTVPNLNSTGRFLRGSTTSGTLQNDAFQGHIHNLSRETPMNFGGTVTSGPSTDHWFGTQANSISVPANDGVNGEPRTATETRPINMAVVWIIKIK